MLNEPLNIEQKEMLIIAVLSGDCNMDDLQKHEYMLKSDEEYTQLFIQYEKIWSKVLENKDIPPIDVTHEWQMMQNRIFNSALPLQKRGLFVQHKQLWRIAAIIVLGIFVAFSYFFLRKPSNIELVAQTEILNTKLPDGSNIALNAFSKISYTKNFSRKHRVLQLDGSAYFEVKHDTAHPFIVQTQLAEIQVLGTVFYINSNKQKNSIKVIVESGKVAMHPADGKHPDLILNAGESAIINSDAGGVEKLPQIDNNAKAWRTKVFEFQNEPLQNVITQISAAYHNNIIIENEALKQCRITVNFNNQNMDAMLKILQEILDLKIKKENNCIRISGKACNN